MAGTVIQGPRVVPAGTAETIQLLAATFEGKTLQGAPTGVGELVVEPAFPGPQPHIHRRHVELFYVLEGTFDFLVGDRAYRLGAGSFVEVPTGVVHDFRNPGPDRARLLGIVSPGDMLSYFEEAQAMFTAGTFSPDALTELRERYDTDEVPIDWAV